MRSKDTSSTDSGSRRYWFPIGLLAILLLGISHLRPDETGAEPSSAQTAASSKAAPPVELAHSSAERDGARVLSAIPPRPEREPIPSERLGNAYLDAYMLADSAKELENDGAPRAALQKLDEAAKLLDQISQEHSGWRSEVVSYRRRKISESIDRLVVADPARPKAKAPPTPEATNPIPTPHPGDDDLGSTYLGAYMLAHEAADLEASGDSATALVKYQEAAAILKTIVQSSPEWRREVVEFRTRKIDDSIARVAQN